MTTSSGRKHAGPGLASDQPPVPEPTFAERARTLVYLGRVGSLSTLSRKQPGFPFGSVMPYGLDDRGRPIFLISTMAMHTQNLEADVRASLLVTQQDTDGEPLGASRVTLVGNVHLVPNTELAEARKLYLERHANSKYWVDFEDFSFYRKCSRFSYQFARISSRFKVLMKLSQLALSYGFAGRLMLGIIRCRSRMATYSPEAYCTPRSE